MKKINDVLLEIDASLRKVDLFFLVTKSLVILFACYFLLYIVGIPPYFSLIPAFVYFFSTFGVQSRIDYARRVELAYPGLDEKLRTARDYKDADNIVLASLEQDILEQLKGVRLSRFFSYPKALALIVVLVLSVSVSVFIASQNLQFLHVNQFVDDAMRKFSDQDQDAVEEGDFTGGAVSVLEVGDERLEVEINPVGLDFDFNEISSPENYEFSTSFPEEVFLAGGASSDSEYTEEQQAIIRRYFDKKASK